MKSVKLEYPFLTDEKHLERTPLGGLFKLLKCLRVSRSQIQANETLIGFEKGFESRLVIITSSNISGCKYTVRSEKFCVIIFFNNISEKWWRRFGFSIVFPNPLY